MSVFSLVVNIIHNPTLTDEEKIKLLGEIGRRMIPNE